MKLSGSGAVTGWRHPLERKHARSPGIRAGPQRERIGHHEFREHARILLYSPRGIRHNDADSS